MQWKVTWSWVRVIFVEIWNKRRAKGVCPIELPGFQNGHPCFLDSFSEKSLGAAKSNLKPSQWGIMTKKAGSKKE